MANGKFISKLLRLVGLRVRASKLIKFVVRKVAAKNTGNTLFSQDFPLIHEVQKVVKNQNHAVMNVTIAIDYSEKDLANPAHQGFFGSTGCELSGRISFFLKSYSWNRSECTIGYDPAII